MIVGPDLALSEEQFARIGRIHVTWAAVEKSLQAIISRLAIAPDWPTGALTDHLIFEHRLRCIDSLLEVHRLQFGNRIVSEDLCTEIAALRKELAKHREMRNRLAHWVLFKSGKDIAAARFATRPATQNREDFTIYKTTDLDAHIIAIMAAAERAMTILHALPEQVSPFDRKWPDR